VTGGRRARARTGNGTGTRTATATAAAKAKTSRIMVGSSDKENQVCEGTWKEIINTEQEEWKRSQWSVVHVLLSVIVTYRHRIVISHLPR
jgi:hypothetical protein